MGTTERNPLESPLLDRLVHELSNANWSDQSSNHYSHEIDDSFNGIQGDFGIGADLSAENFGSSGGERVKAFSNTHDSIETKSCMARLDSYFCAESMVETQEDASAMVDITSETDLGAESLAKLMELAEETAAEIPPAGTSISPSEPAGDKRDENGINCAPRVSFDSGRVFLAEAAGAEKLDENARAGTSSSPPEPAGNKQNENGIGCAPRVSFGSGLNQELGPAFPAEAAGAEKLDANVLAEMLCGVDSGAVDNADTSRENDDTLVRKTKAARGKLGGTCFREPIDIGSPVMNASIPNVKKAEMAHEHVEISTQGVTSCAFIDIDTATFLHETCLVSQLKRGTSIEQVLQNCAVPYEIVKVAFADELQGHSMMRPSDIAEWACLAFLFVFDRLGYASKYTKSPSHVVVASCANSSKYSVEISEVQHLQDIGSSLLKDSPVDGNFDKNTVREHQRTSIAYVCETTIVELHPGKVVMRSCRKQGNLQSGDDLAFILIDEKSPPKGLIIGGRSRSRICDLPKEVLLFLGIAFDPAERKLERFRNLKQKCSERRTQEGTNSIIELEVDGAGMLEMLACKGNGDTPAPPGPAATVLHASSDANGYAAAETGVEEAIRRLNIEMPAVYGNEDLGAGTVLHASSDANGHAAAETGIEDNELEDFAADESAAATKGGAIEVANARNFVKIEGSGEDTICSELTSATSGGTSSAPAADAASAAKHEDFSCELMRELTDSEDERVAGAFACEEGSENEVCKLPFAANGESVSILGKHMAR